MATVAIIGCAGYTGQETLDRVIAHPELEPVALGSDSLAGKPAWALDPRLDAPHLPPFVPVEGARGGGARPPLPGVRAGRGGRGGRRRPLLPVPRPRRRGCVRIARRGRGRRPLGSPPT